MAVPKDFTDLSEDLYINILSRLTIKELARIKCVSKFLNKFLESTSIPTLVKFQRNFFVQFDENSMWLLGLGEDVDNVIDSKRLIVKYPYTGTLSLTCIGCCNGLIGFVSCQTNRRTRDDHYAVWNPITNDFRYLPSPTFVDCRGYYSSVFVYFPAISDYVIVRLFDCLEKTGTSVELYYMSLDMWLAGPSINEKLDDIRRPIATAYDNEKIYWAIGLFVCSRILAYNVNTGEFDYIQPPDTGYIVAENEVNFAFVDGITVMDGLLSYCTWLNSVETKIWSYQDDGWNIIWMGDLNTCVISYWMRGSFFSSLFPSYYFANILSRQIRSIGDYDSGHVLFAGNFVATMASVGHATLVDDEALEPICCSNDAESDEMELSDPPDMVGLGGDPGMRGMADVEVLSWDLPDVGYFFTGNDFNDTGVEGQVAKKLEGKDSEKAGGTVPTKGVPQGKAEAPYKSFISLHPEIKWAQKEDKIFIRVLMADTKCPKINLGSEGVFKFSATAGTENHSYELELKLFDKVNVKQSKFNIGPRSTFCILEKAERKWWKELLKGDANAPVYVKIDNEDSAALKDTGIDEMEFSDFSDMVGLGGEPGVGSMAGVEVIAWDLPDMNNIFMGDDFDDADQEAE